jgi:biopolymer transport protein ExbD
VVLPRPSRRRNSILLTSLVDVLFVLLFFFMLTSSVLDFRSVTIDAQAAAPGGGAADASVLEVLPGRQLRLGAGEPFAFDALPAQVAAQGVRAVTVLPAAGVPLQDLVDVIEALRRAAVALSLARSAP